MRRSPSTLNRVKTLHVTRQKARQRVVNQQASIKRIGVLGAGLMGTGIAYTAARAGYEVLVVDVSHEASERSLQRMKKIAEQDANSGLLKQANTRRFVEPRPLGPRNCRPRTVRLYRGSHF